MPSWAGYLLAFATLVAAAPLVAWLGRRHGRTIKGGAALASVMLGMGAMFDPPVRALAEAREEQVGGDDENGEPKDDPEAGD